MKNFLYILLIFLNIACNQATEDDRKNCRLVGFNNLPSKNYDHQFEYDSTGKVIKMIRNGILDNGDSFANETQLFYDSLGRLSSQKYKSFWNDTLDHTGIEHYTWENNRIVRSNYKLDDGGSGYNNLRYDSLGRLIEHTYEGNEKTPNSIENFEYSSDGILIKYIYKKSTGEIVHEFRVKPSGKTVKMPQILLQEAGIPFDIVFGKPFATLVGTESVFEEYYPDKTGKLVLGKTTKEIVLETNEDGIVTKRKSGKFSINFILENCNK